MIYVGKGEDISTRSGQVQLHRIKEWTLSLSDGKAVCRNIVSGERSTSIVFFTVRTLEFVTLVVSHRPSDQVDESSDTISHLKTQRDGTSSKSNWRVVQAKLVSAHHCPISS